MPTLSLHLWSHCGIAQTIIFLPCGFFLLLSSFFPRLISAVADWVSAILLTWCGLSANSECRSEMCCTRLARNARRKKLPKIAIWTPSHNFICYIFATKARIDSRKKLLSSNIASTCPHNMVNFSLIAS